MREKPLFLCHQLLRLQIKSYQQHFLVSEFPGPSWTIPLGHCLGYGFGVYALAADAHDAHVGGAVFMKPGQLMLMMRTLWRQAWAAEIQMRPLGRPLF